MKTRIFTLFAVCTLGSWQVLAQEDNTLSPAQEEVIRQIVRDIGQACTLPTTPAIPDGNAATQEEMLSAQSTLKAYIESGNNYLGCLDALEKSWGEDASDTQKAVIVSVYNQTVERLQNQAKSFNESLKVFQAKSSN